MTTNVHGVLAKCSIGEQYGVRADEDRGAHSISHSMRAH